jgi:peptide/nickel transport system ATP-binding protein
VTHDALMEVRELSVGYEHDDGSVLQVVRDVSLRMDRGTIVGLAGESGCGKSTTALAAIGYRPARGHILGGTSSLGGVDLLLLPPSKLRDFWGGRLAYVAQSAALALNPAMTVGRQLAQPLVVHRGLRGRRLQKRQLELLEAVSMPDPEGSLRRYPFQFSGGQQQKIALAIALSCEPEVLILDEPTTGLDVTTQATITALLRRLVTDLDIACLYVSHDLALLATLTDRLAVMYAGELVEEGATEAVVRAPRHPYTQALLSAAPSLHRPGDIVGIPGMPPLGVVDGACSYAPRCPHVIARCRAGSIEVQTAGKGHLARCIRIAAIESAPRIGSGLAVGTAGTEVLLEVDRLLCEYPGARHPAVGGVSLVVRPAERVGIAGESGSGKSTLLRAIVGLHRPSSGAIRFRNVAVEAHATQRSRALRREIQIVFQNPDSSLNPRHTILDIVSRPLRLFRDDVSREEEEHAVLELLDAVRLSSAILARYPSELSGGQRQRVALARAFAARPSVLLCDEVTSALDVSVQASILELIAELSVDMAAAIVWVTHDLAVLRAIATRGYVMRDGVVCDEGNTDEMFDTSDHPYTRELIAAVPDLHAAMR